MKESFSLGLFACSLIFLTIKVLSFLSLVEQMITQSSNKNLQPHAVYGNYM